MEVAGTEPATKIPVIQHLHLKGKVALEILHDQDQKWEPNTKTGVGANGTVDIGGAHVVSNYFKRYGPNAGIGDSLYMAVHHLKQASPTNCNEILEESESF